MERIEEQVRRQLRRVGAPGGLPELLAAWTEVTGPEIARNAWPARVARDGTLHIATSSATWAFELTQLAPEIHSRLRERLGSGSPSGLRFAPGQVPESSTPTVEQTPRQPPEPEPEELRQAAQFAARIEDGGLRETVQRAAALSLATARVRPLGLVD
jgi:hypothetical protein